MKNIVTEKRCTKCKELKSINEFSSNKNGKVSWCKACYIEPSRNYYNSHKEEIKQKIKLKRNDYFFKEGNRERQREWYKNNLEHSRLVRRIREHKRRSLVAGSFTKKEWKDLCDKYGNKCLCCGREGKLSIDHVIPLIKGGSNLIDNIQPLCLTCNMKKHDKTIDYRK